MKKILILVISLIIVTPNFVRASEDLAPNSKSAILIEESSGEILFQKNIHEKLAPASMTKIMSMLLIMEAIEEGQLELNEEITISENASSMGGSQIFLETGTKVKVDDLLKGIAIASANDAVVALAEKIGGTELKFVDMMNQKVKELNLKNTNFKNPHGLDDADHYTSAYDMAIIAQELLKYESILNYTRIYEEYLTKPDGSQIWLVNTNRLVRFYEGVDGLKTGYTTSAGYCLTTTIEKNNLRLISVVMNAPTSDARSSDTTKLLNYGFNGYKLNLVLEKDTDLGEVQVINGKEESVGLKLLEDVTDLLKTTDKKKDYSYTVLVDKVKAPVKLGDVVGNIQILEDGKILKEVPVTVEREVKEANILDNFFKNIKTIFSGKAVI